MSSFQPFELKYIKAAVLSLGLFAESLLISNILFGFSKTGNYISPRIESLIMLMLLLLLMTYTYALTVGIWENKLQYLIIPFPISLGIAAVVAQVDLLPALIVLTAVYVLSAYDVYVATRIQNLLLKFDPITVLKSSTKGLLFIFAATAAVFVLLNPKAAQQIDIAKELSKIVNTQLDAYLKSELGGLGNLGGQQPLGESLQSTVQQQIEKIINPYRKFILPILALISLGLIQFLNIFVYILFALSVKPLYYLAKRTGFFKTTKVAVEKEVISL